MSETLVYPKPRYAFDRIEGVSAITYNIVLLDNVELVEVAVLMGITPGYDWYDNSDEIKIIRPLVV